VLKYCQDIIRDKKREGTVCLKWLGITEDNVRVSAREDRVIDYSDNKAFLHLYDGNAAYEEKEREIRSTVWVCVRSDHSLPPVTGLGRGKA